MAAPSVKQKRRKNNPPGNASTTKLVKTKRKPGLSTNAPAPSGMAQVSNLVGNLAAFPFSTDIVQALQTELQNAAALTDPLVQSAMLSTTLTRASEYASLLVDAAFVVNEQPHRRAAIEAELKNSLTSSAVDRARLATRLATFVADSKTVAAAALVEVNTKTDQELKALGMSRWTELARDLQRGGQDRKDDRRSALVRVYQATELDPQFQAAELAALDSALLEVRSIPNIKERRRVWPTLARAGKIALLQEVLDAHCRALNIVGSDVPRLVLYSDAPQAKAAARGDHDNGFYDSTAHAIYLNDDKDGFKQYFDEMLDAVVHENTHNRQRMLVRQLGTPAAPPIGSGDHLQISLFELNSGATGYIDAPSAGYKEQPVERHAWLAGGVAGKLFGSEAIDALTTLKTEVQTFRAGQVGPLASTLDGYVGRLDAVLAGDHSAGHITREVTAVRLQLGDRIRESQASAPGSDLIVTLDGWIGKPGLSAGVKQRAEELKARVADTQKATPQSRRTRLLEALKMEVDALEE